MNRSEASHGYAIRGGREGKQRLNLLARVMLPTTSQLLKTVGLRQGMECLDVGCGGGHVSLLMASMIGPAGKVVGTDTDKEIVVEDVDFAGSFCYPIRAAYERYFELYQKVVARRGGDPNIGPKLPGMLRKAGAKGIQLNVVQPTHLQGEGKLMASMTMERISGAVISEGLATESEVQQIVNELNHAATDCETAMSLPRVFQVWGRSRRGD